MFDQQQVSEQRLKVASIHDAAPSRFFADNLHPRLRLVDELKKIKVETS